MTVDILRAELSLDGHDISVETSGTPGGGVSVVDRLLDPEHYKGPSEFDTVVEFGSLYESSGMRGSMVPKEERWSAKNFPPKPIVIGEFISPHIAANVRAIEAIAREEFYSNPWECYKYYQHNRAVFNQMAAIGKIDPSRYVFMSLVRAGIPAGEFLGFPLENQILIQSKRLQLKDGGIAIGQTYYNPRQQKRFDGREVLIGDPAGATFGSALAALLDLEHQDYRPKSVTIINTCASHKGSLFMAHALSYLGYDFKILSAGYSPGMNDKFYLETADGSPSVRDAGDGLNSFLPPEFQL